MIDNSSSLSPNQYRPKRFDDIIGQTKVINALRNQLHDGNIANAYLFAGIRGVGKTSTARILAKALLCSDTLRNQVDACDECESCKSFDLGYNNDFLELDAGSKGGIDQIREIQSWMQQVPNGPHKVVIIDEAHCITSNSASAMLKMLEEPINNTIFILATTEPRRIIDTIRSRCQLMMFNRIPSETIGIYLKGIAVQQGQDADDDAIRIIASQSDGSMRDAITAFQTISSMNSNQAITIDNTRTYYGSYESSNVTSMLCELATNMANQKYDRIVGFTQRHDIMESSNEGEGIDISSLVIMMMNVISTAIIIISCGDEEGTKLSSATKSEKEAGTVLVSSLRANDNINDAIILEKLISASDAIESRLERLSDPRIPKHHAFNEIALEATLRLSKGNQSLSWIQDEFDIVKHRVGRMDQALKELIKIMLSRQN